MDRDRPIFVFGCPRSGTTLLQVMLHAHRRIAIPPENRFVLAGYYSRRQFGDLRDPEHRRALARWITTRPQSRFRDLELDPQVITEEIVAGPPTLGSAIGIVLRAYARRFGKPRWGDKRPGYHQHLPALLRLFPDAQLVHLVRDGRDCVASLKEMSWWRHDVYHAIATWAQAVDSGRRAARALPPDAYCELRYERLVSDPERELGRLCAFLGEEYDPAMCEPYKIASVAVPERKSWHVRTRGEISAARIGSWQERLDPWEIQLCETVLGRRLRANGYQLSGAGRPAIDHLVRYTEVAAKRRLGIRKRNLIDLWRRVRDREDLADHPQPVTCRM